MAQLIMLPAKRSPRPRPRRTWDDEGGFGGMREAEARESRAQRDSDTRERAERDRGSRGDNPKSAPGKKRGAIARMKDWFNNTRLGRGLKMAGRVGAAVVTGGASETALGLAKLGKSALDKRAARAGVSGPSRASNGPASRVGGTDRRERSSDGGGGLRVASVSTLMARTTAAPTPAATIAAPAPVAAPTFITPPEQIAAPVMTLQTMQAMPTPILRAAPTPRPWMDGESIPGVSNKTLVIGAAVLGGVLLMRRK